ncbi:MAG: CAP domain-containing protein [Polyangiales bacterium]
MLRVYRATLLLGLLTSSLMACSDSHDLLDDEAPSTRDDDGALSDEDTLGDDDAPTRDDEDEQAPTGSTRDAGTAQTRDAASDASTAANPSDASVPDAASDAGYAPNDAGTPIADAGPAPSGSVCPATDGWDAQAAAFEEQVLALTNAARAAGHNCDTKGNFGAAPPLTMQNQLRCAARLHSKYMATTGEFNHTQATTGKDPGARIREAGYQARTWGENIAWGQRTPADVVNGWLESDGHCANIMNPAFKQLGVGYALGARTGRQAPYWTQNFGTSR